MVGPVANGGEAVAPQGVSCENGVCALKPAAANGVSAAPAKASEAPAVAAAATVTDGKPARLVVRREGEGAAALGFVELPDPARTTLADVRRLVAKTWDCVPKDMTFLWGEVPVARKQEAEEVAATYLPTLTVRLKSDGKKKDKENKQAKKQKVVRDEEEEEGEEGEENEENEEDEEVDQGEVEEGKGSGKDSENKKKEKKKSVTDLSCKAFKVEEKWLERLNPCTGEKIKERQVNVTTKNIPLIDTMRRITREEIFYVGDEYSASADFKGVTFPASMILDHMDDLRENVYRNGDVARLLKVVEDEDTLKELTSKYAKMVEEGEISFRALWFLFKKGQKVLGREGPSNEWKVGLEITSTEYRRCFWSGPRFVVRGKVVKANGKGFYQADHEFEISGFAKTKAIAELPVQLLEDDDSEMQELAQRGALFRSIGVGNHYLAYSGNVLTRSWWCGFTQIKAAGRVMVDPLSFRRYNPNYPGGSRDNTEVVETIPDEQLFCTWPTVTGFSFAAKKWGELVVQQLQEVQYDNEAFQQLVAPPEKKVLIKALVENNEESFQDIITGKGGGCIFLLHGPPGTGKTLTAEAIAELLHRPLYSVAVGELGTSTNDLESKLRQILELSSVWNAVLLIDEADIFLEKRSENDIQRNAMVGIFLRLLEYHQGVLFLTTNRIKAFDPAFHSRISVALKYGALGAEARAQVWRHLLQAAGLPVLEQGSDSKEAGGLDAEELAQYELNGRQIKNTIRLAQSLARSESTALDASHIRRTVLVAQQFQRDIGGDQDLTGHAFDGC